MNNRNGDVGKISNLPPVLQEVANTSIDYCIDNDVARITPEVLTLAVLNNKKVKDNLIGHGLRVETLYETIDGIAKSKKSSTAVKAGSVGFNTDTYSIVASLLIDDRFSEGDRRMTHMDILRAIYECENSAMHYILTTQAPDVSEKLFRDEEEKKRVMDEELEELIEQFCINYTDLAAEGNLDPVIGREMEITEVSEILARKKKNNVVLLGDPGCGKTSIVEGLAMAIVEGNAPKSIENHEVISIEVSGLLAGTKYRGEFEERVRNILKGLSQRGNTIVFIDEAHTVMNAGASTSGGGVDLANIMKPMLARGELTCIAATTFEEYRKTIQKDGAMVRRFQNYTIHEPTDDHVMEIIEKLTPNYSNFHGVNYPSNFHEIALDYGKRFLQTKSNPDKSIDIMDAAGAYVKVSGRKDVTLDDVAYVVSKMSGVPKDSMNHKESNVFSGLEDRIKEQLFNQDHVIDGVVEELIVAKAGMKEDNKPLGSFLMVGSSGCGKTQFLRLLAKELNLPLVKIDMSEYQEKHSVAKLIGSPPGYAGYDENSAKLIDEIEKNPNCILLLDEVEKAHPQVMSIFLQIMDDATLTSSHGKVAKFNNVIIAMTSNLGAKSSNTTSMGFAERKGGSSDIKKAVEAFFLPEFLNRLNAVYTFNNLDESAMVKIVHQEVKELNDRMAEKNVVVELDDEVVNYLAKEGFDPGMGARPLKRIFSDTIKRKVSREVVMGSLMDGGKVIVKMVDGEITVQLPGDKEPA